MQIGNNIKELREKNNLSQTELAVILKTTKRTLDLWEKDLKLPRTINVISIAEYFNVSIDFLIGRKK
jgi:transcriptional regulator with XRE-family HTH domain